MTQDKRKFDGSFSVRIGTGRVRFELAPASDYGGPEGLYRVRIDRRWYDSPEGELLFLSVAAVGELAAMMSVGRVPSLPKKPNLPRGTSVNAPNGDILAGVPQRDVTRTDTEPFRGYDGRWYVGVTIYGKGCMMVPVDDLIVKESKKKPRLGPGLREVRV